MTNTLPPFFYIRFKGETVIIVKDALTGNWMDAKGTLYAYYDPNSSSDSTSRCGVGLASLPTTPFFQPLNDGCNFHDEAYSNPVYQAYHTRAEADAQLEAEIKLEEGPWIGGLIGRAFRIIASLFGGSFWENKNTQ